MKKFTTYLLAIIMCISLCACGTSTTSDNTKTKDVVLSDDTVKIDKIISSIDNIGEVTADKYASIKEIYATYSQLSIEEKNMVTNAEKLESAIALIKKAQQEQAQELLNNMNVIKDDVQNISHYLPKAIPLIDGGLSPYERSYVLPYIEQGNNETKIRTIFNYTGDSWIFYKKVTFAIDDERFEKTINRNDITRDNDAGDVFEIADIYPSDDVIEILRKIASSQKTIIRLEGDDYYYDITVTDIDKTAIKNVLDVYDLLK